ncbi:MAG: homocysteine S-methyltransferase [Microbacteriaceae bacterium]|jgi:homocysteine S-methyltransferase|nr:homocysteine S-methyltransferase [Microbacteriaceae bacterium]HEV7956983.1 homocysteine S-methyltransferase family protein [Marisediminicola sp.]
MPKYRTNLPQLEEGALFLTDGGLETSVIFHEGIELPHFAACELLRSDVGSDVLRSYFNHYAALAVALGVGLSLDTATWRANPDWTSLLGYDAEEFDAVNRRSVQLAEKIRRVWETDATPIVIAGAIGPRGDGYRADERQSAQQAASYHSRQIDVFADTEVDFVSALTINYSAEAIGLARAAKAMSMPISISFTVETDGRMASGETVVDAIAAVDADTGSYPEYYMVNCVHPTHFPEDFHSSVAAQRLRGFRANASRLSHAELDESETLDAGDPDELGLQILDLRERMPQLSVLGGCCGTDVRHIESMARQLLSARAA